MASAPGTVSRVIALAAMLAGGLLPMAAADEISDLPSHVQATTKEILAEAKSTWHPDAYVTGIALAVDRGAGPAERYLVFTLYAPSTRSTETIPRGKPGGDRATPIPMGSVVDLGPIPDFTIDLPPAVAIARKHGLTGDLDRAYLEVHHPAGKAPILAWIVGAKKSLGSVPAEKMSVIDSYTGAVIPFLNKFEPPSGSDSTLAAAARHYWMALHLRFQDSSHMPFAFGTARVGAQGEAEQGYFSSDAQDEETELENTYWGDGPEAYEGAFNGESLWTEICNSSAC